MQYLIVYFSDHVLVRSIEVKVQLIKGIVLISSLSSLNSLFSTSFVYILGLIYF